MPSHVHAKPALQPVYGLVIHGGAGAPANLDDADQQRYHAKLQESLDAGYAVLEGGGSAMDAVVVAVKVMEDAGLFDAGKGSVFNADGVCEMDACIMDGRACAAGSAAGLQHIKNPIELARAILDKTPHVMLIGEGAERLARACGFEMLPKSYFQTERRRQQWEEIRRKEAVGGSRARPSPPEATGTVGCAALDSRGNLAAGTSTGGVVNKMPGRVGDSPIVGAGTYADNDSCAVSGTGQGEFFIRTVFAHRVATLIEHKGLSVGVAAQQALEAVRALGGSGGCVAIDREGNIAMPFNTAAMFRGGKLSTGRNETAILPASAT